MTGHLALVFAPEREAVAQRAYEIYVRKGKRLGHEMEDWLEAEEELEQEAACAIATWNPYFGYVAQLLAFAEADAEVMMPEDEEVEAIVHLLAGQ